MMKKYSILLLSGLITVSLVKGSAAHAENCLKLWAQTGWKMGVDEYADPSTWFQYILKKYKLTACDEDSKICY